MDPAPRMAFLHIGLYVADMTTMVSFYNRHGLVVNVQASTSEGTAERDVAAQMLANVAGPGKRVTVGADKAYDTKGFVKASREINVTPHVAQPSSVAM